MENISPLAGKLAPRSILADIPKLISAYYIERPDPAVPGERVKFGTSGHRGSSINRSFNETHILAMTQAICDYRKKENITGPLFLGIDTHALSIPAYSSTLEVLAANGIDVFLAEKDEYTPTPVISHAILTYNRGRKTGLSDGIVITPSHNPPEEGGFKYNPPNGGPAEPVITNWIEMQANALIHNGLNQVFRMTYEKALQSPFIRRRNYMNAYIEDLKNVIDMEAIAKSQIKIAADPMGGAGVHYWKLIAEKYGLNLTVISETLDPDFRFMHVDWDGKIRMDPSSIYPMRPLIDLKESYQVAFACDTDHDRHGIVTKNFGLLATNHYLSAAIAYLFPHRPGWSKTAGVGKTVVSSLMIDYVSAKAGRQVYEVPVGFKWFVEGLIDGSLAFVGEESAGASFVRFDGSVWTTDKDGIIASLLSAEITARLGKDPGVIYSELTGEFGKSYSHRFEAIASQKERDIIMNLTPEQIQLDELAGEKIQSIFNTAPGNGQPIGGIKAVAKTGWFAARPSGTEDIYRIYVESFQSDGHMQRILEQAKSVVEQALKKEML